MVRHPAVYAELWGEKIEKHATDCWLINTGGAYGEGHRIALEHTRTMVNAALYDPLTGDVDIQPDGVFGLHIPTAVEGVPHKVLFPRQTWSNPDAYDMQARRLARMFADNFKQCEDTAADEAEQAARTR